MVRSASKKGLRVGRAATLLIGLAVRLQDGVRRNDTVDGGKGTDTCTTDSGDQITRCEE